MLKFKLFLLLLLLLCGLTIVKPRHLYHSEQGPDPNRGKISVKYVMLQLAQRDGCFFTIEEAWPTPDEAQQLQRALVSEPDKDEPVNKVLDRIKQEVPFFTYEYDKVDGRIIHIVNKRLTSDPGYAISQTVPVIEFQGTTTNLIRKLASEGIRVQASGGVFIGDPIPGDINVEIKKTNLTVREALSAFVPLNDPGRIIWEAYTETKPGAPTIIRYDGENPLLKRNKN